MVQILFSYRRERRSAGIDYRFYGILSVRINIFSFKKVSYRFFFFEYLKDTKNYMVLICRYLLRIQKIQPVPRIEAQIIIGMNKISLLRYCKEKLNCHFDTTSPDLYLNTHRKIFRKLHIDFYFADLVYLCEHCQMATYLRSK